MSGAMEARAEAIGTAAVARVVADGAARVRAVVPADVQVTTAPGAIVLSGRGLTARRIDDDRLRWIGSVVR